MSERERGPDKGGRESSTRCILLLILNCVLRRLEDLHYDFVLNSFKAFWHNLLCWVGFIIVKSVESIEEQRSNWSTMSHCNPISPTHHSTSECIWTNAHGLRDQKLREAKKQAEEARESWVLSQNQGGCQRARPILRYESRGNSVSWTSTNGLSERCVWMLYYFMSSISNEGTQGEERVSWKLNGFQRVSWKLIGF